MGAAVLFLVFNRPGTTARVFEAIRRARPARLYVAADGPRRDRPSDLDRVAEVRRIATTVNWPCEVGTRFQEENLGCRLAVSGALDWFFEHEAEGIILEDDCLPDGSFFGYCEELLERYRDEPRVMMVSGTCRYWDNRLPPVSYRFSRNVHIWGWATWRRAWRRYDRDLSAWPTLRRSTWLRDVGDGHRDFRNHWAKLFDQLRDSQKPGTWDYQWIFSCWASGGLSVSPARNLVMNIGFGEDATHTTDASGERDPAEAIALPLVHPAAILRDVPSDRWEDLHIYDVQKRRNLEFLRNSLRRIPGLRLIVLSLRDRCRV